MWLFIQIVRRFFILTFFDQTLSDELIAKILFFIFVLFCFCFSLLVNHYLKTTEYKYLTFYIVALCVSPIFISLLWCLGIVDLFWMFPVMLGLICVSRKGIRWLVPFFCIICFAIHESFALTYMLVFGIIIFYQFAKNPRPGSFIYFLFSTIIVVGAAYYFLFVGHQTMKMSPEELQEYINGRLDTGGHSYDTSYINYVFFWRDVPTSHNPEGGANNYLDYIYTLFFDFFLKYPDRVRKVFFYFFYLFISSLLPVSIFIKSFKNETLITKKLAFALSTLPLPLSIATLILSTDTDRFAFHAVFSIFILILFFIKENDSTFKKSYEDLLFKLKSRKLSIFIICLVFFNIVFSEVQFS